MGLLYKTSTCSFEEAPPKHGIYYKMTQNQRAKRKKKDNDDERILGDITCGRVTLESGKNVLVWTLQTYWNPSFKCPPSFKLGRYYQKVKFGRNKGRRCTHPPASGSGGGP